MKNSYKYIFWYITVILIMIVSCQYKEPEGNADTNDGIIAQNDWREQLLLSSLEDCGYGQGWSYHIKETETFVYYISDSGIIRIDKKTGEHAVIIPNTSDYAIDTMLIDDGLIYYVAHYKHYKDCKIFTSDLEGNNVTLLVDAGLFYKSKELIWSGFVESIFLSDNVLYFTSSVDVVSYNINDKQFEMFSDNVLSAVFWRNKFYYIDRRGLDTFTIYEKDIATGEENIIKGDGISKVDIDRDAFVIRCDGLYVFNNELYYSERCPARLYRYNPDGEDQIIADFTEESAVGGYAHNRVVASAGSDCIYYIFYNDIYRYDPVTNESMKLATIDGIDENKDYGFFVVDDIIIYSDNDNVLQRKKLSELQ